MNNFKQLEEIRKAADAVGKELNERKFTEKDLVSFGEFLLSTERTKHFTDLYNKEDNISLEDRLKEVYHSDLQNYYHLSNALLKKNKYIEYLQKNLELQEIQIEEMQNEKIIFAGYQTPIIKEMKLKN